MRFTSIEVWLTFCFQFLIEFDMSDNKKSSRNRWSDSEFQAAVASTVRALVCGSAVITDADIAGISIGKTGPIKQLWAANLYRAKLINVDMSFASLACSINERAAPESVALCARRTATCAPKSDPSRMIPSRRPWAPDPSAIR